MVEVLCFIFGRYLYSNLLSTEILPPEHFFVILNLQKWKWFASCLYNPYRNNNSRHVTIMSKNIDIQLDMKTLSFEQIKCWEWWGAQEFSTSCEFYNLSSLTKQPTCFQNPTIKHAFISFLQIFFIVFKIPV